jgi:hypothetical protein
MKAKPVRDWPRILAITAALGLAFSAGGWVAYKFASPCVCVVITKAVV